MSKASEAREKLNRKIRARNKKFAQMTPAQKRVAIAKDVLAALKVKLIRPRQGLYMELSESAGKKLFRHGMDTDLQDALPTLENCEVCAKGAIFVATVMASNDCPIRDAFPELTTNDAVNADEKEKEVYNEYGDHDVSFDTMDDVNRRFFPRLMLDRIEAYFEALYPVDDYSVSDEVRIRRRREFAAKRMMAIMNNIIENKGEFHPEQLAEQLKL